MVSWVMAALVAASPALAKPAKALKRAAASSTAAVAAAAPAVSATSVVPGGKPAMVKTAVIRTERGTFRFVLLDAIAPKHVESFVALTKKGYYQNLTFHRVIPGMLIQGGDPQGTGMGGPGYTVKAEFSDYPYTAGTVGMARTNDPDSAGSQFFVARRPMPQWNGSYTVFGQVYEGMDVVNAVAQGDHMQDVKIEEVPRDKVPPAILR